MCVGWEGMMENVVGHQQEESSVPIAMWRRVSLPDDLSLPFQLSFLTIIPIHTTYPPQLPHSPLSWFRLYSQYSQCLALFLPWISLSLNPTHFTKCVSRKVYSMILSINYLKLIILYGISVIYFFNVIFRLFLQIAFFIHYVLIMIFLSLSPFQILPTF